jgi:urease accessory protein
VKALARIVAEADGRGGTRLTELYGEAPLLPRRTGPRTDPGGGAVAEVHLVGGAAGPLGGDELCLEVHIGPDAALAVHTVAASIVLPGEGRSSTRVHATVAAGGRLDWLPEPVVAAKACDHLGESIVELHGDARLRWREELVCGRHGEECGDLTLSTSVSRDGTPLYRQDLAVGPRADGWSGAAVLGGYRTAGTLILVGHPWPGPSTMDGPTATSAAMELAAGGTVVTAAATHAHHLRRHLTDDAAPPRSA